MTAFQTEYDRYLSLYMQMHSEDPNVFVGKSTAKHSKDIKELIKLTGAVSLIDYGCGKGRQYTEHRLHEEWGVPQPYLYDPAYSPYNKLPECDRTFDGVICTDVLEHVPEDGLDYVLDDLFTLADKFVFINVSTRPAGRKLPNGENAHCTVKPHSWWENIIEGFYMQANAMLGGNLHLHLESHGRKGVNLSVYVNGKGEYRLNYR